MAVGFTCANTECRRELSVGDELAGKKVKCPRCKGVMVVPHRGDELPACPSLPGVADTPTGYEATMAMEGQGERGKEKGRGDDEGQREGNGTAEDAENAEGKKGDVQEGGVEELDAFLDAKRVGRSEAFERERELARGGMGAVILARDKAIQRELAVKVMRPQIADSEEHRLRFLEEAQVTGQLEHPNIVPIHELGKDAEGNLYFTMKLVKGKSLGEIIEEIKGAEGASRKGAKAQSESERAEAGSPGRAGVPPASGGESPPRSSALQSGESENAGLQTGQAELGIGGPPVCTSATMLLPDVLSHELPYPIPQHSPRRSR